MTRALIIEDSRTQARKLTDLFAAQGFEVEVAHDGPSGIAACKARLPDFVVSDVVMPGCDGFEVCRQLRSDPATAKVPFMLLTSLGDPLDVLRALAAGADNFATKPYRDADILARVQRLISGHIANESGELRIHSELIAVTASRQTMLEVLFSALEDASARNAELEASRAALERASAARDEMLGIVAHELRAPITSLALRAQLASRKKSAAWPVEATSMIEGVERSTSRMLRIIGDLLQVTQLEAGSFAIDAQMGDLAEVAREVVARATGAHPEFSIQLVSPEHVLLRCDAARIEQVLINLVGNAIKYSGERRRVTVEMVRSETSITTRVSDSGIGIPPEQLPRVFERFYRTQEGKQAAAGTGLGLYVSRRLVELHGGTIHAESTPGEGSTFTFTLPVRE